MIRPNQAGDTHDEFAYIGAQELPRRQDVPAQHLPGVHRILVLGDLFTFENGVIDDQAYPAVVILGFYAIDLVLRQDLDSMHQ